MSPEVLKHEGYNAKSDIWYVSEWVLMGCVAGSMISKQEKAHVFVYRLVVWL